MISQAEIIRMVQLRTDQSGETRDRILAFFPSGLRYLLGRFPQQSMVLKIVLTAEAADKVYMPSDFGSVSVVWTERQSTPAKKMSPERFAQCKSQGYAGSHYICTQLVEKSTGRRFLEFMPNIGTGTTITLWYYQEPGLASLNLIPAFLTDALIRWLIRELCPDGSIVKGAYMANPKYVRVALELKEALEDIDVLSQDPGEEIQGRLPDD